MPRRPERAAVVAFDCDDRLVPWSPLPNPEDDEARVKPLKQVLDQVLAGLGAPSVDTVITITERWAELVGTEVAPHARPMAVEHKKLTVVVDNPAWASHFRWAEPELVRRLGDLVGDGVVERVSIRVARR